jgi:hypothetical protein
MCLQSDKIMSEISELQKKVIINQNNVYSLLDDFNINFGSFKIQNFHLLLFFFGVQGMQLMDENKRLRQQVCVLPSLLITNPFLLSTINVHTPKFNPQLSTTHMFDHTVR